MFDNATSPASASELSHIVGELVNAWGVSTVAATHSGLCLQQAVAGFGQDPVAAGAGRCRVRCQQAVDSCGICGGSSFPHAAIEGGSNIVRVKRSRDAQITAIVDWNSSTCASTHELLYEWTAPLPLLPPGTDTPVLTIPRAALLQGGASTELTLLVAVVPLGGNVSADATWQQELRVTMLSLRSPLVARILGGDRDVPAFVDVTLDVYFRIDNDRPTAVFLDVP